MLRSQTKSMIFRFFRFFKKFRKKQNPRIKNMRRNKKHETAKKTWDESVSCFLFGGYYFRNHIVVKLFYNMLQAGYFFGVQNILYPKPWFWNFGVQKIFYTPSHFNGSRWVQKEMLYLVRNFKLRVTFFIKIGKIRDRHRWKGLVETNLSVPVSHFSDFYEESYAQFLKNPKIRTGKKSRQTTFPTGTFSR